MQHKDFYRNILRLSLPAAVQSSLSLLVVMADNVMVTRLDSQGMALAAVAQSNAITNFVNAGLTGLAAGGVVLVSQYWGKQDLRSIKRVGAVMLSAALAFALLLSLLILLFPKAVLSLVINPSEQEVTALALQYLPVLVFSYLPTAISFAVVGLLRGVEVVRALLYATLASLGSNVLLNYLLIFGKLGLPALGIRGAAIATVLARMIEAGVAVYYLLRRQKKLPVQAGELAQHARWAWQDYARHGLPVAFVDSQWALIGALKMVIIGQLGRVMMSAVAVTDMLMNLGTMFTFALAGGAAVVMGKVVGAGDYALAKEYAKRIQWMFLLIGIVMATLVFLIRQPFISLYQMGEEASTLARRMVEVCALTLVGTSYHAACFVGINRGAGDNRFVMRVDMICGWLIVLPSAAIAAFVLRLPFHWVYFATRIDQCFKWIIAFLRLRGDKWIHNLTREHRAQ